MKSAMKSIVLTVVAASLGCASLTTPVMNLPLKDDGGTYEISYDHKKALDCNYYYIATVVTSGRHYFYASDVTLYKQMYEREMLFPGAKEKIRNIYSLAFHQNTESTVAPEFFLVVDGRQFKLVFRSGRTQTITSRGGGGRSKSVHTTLTYNVSSDLLNAMKTMKSMSLKVGNVSQDLDTQSVSRVSSFVVDSLGFDYQGFHEKVTALKK